MGILRALYVAGIVLVRAAAPAAAAPVIAKPETSSPELAPIYKKLQNGSDVRGIAVAGVHFHSP